MTDRARAEDLVAQLSTQEMADFRPEILGSVMIKRLADSRGVSSDPVPDSCGRADSRGGSTTPGPTI